VPVLILTGHSDEETIRQSVKLRIHVFLTKPVSKVNLEKNSHVGHFLPTH